MTSIQGINVINCKDLAKLYASVQTKQFIVADTIIEVFDRYNIDLSVKTCQRARRTGRDDHQKVYNVKGSRPITPWKKISDVYENKLPAHLYRLELEVPGSNPSRAGYL